LRKKGGKEEGGKGGRDLKQQQREDTLPRQTGVEEIPWGFLLGRDKRAKQMKRAWKGK